MNNSDEVTLKFEMDTENTEKLVKEVIHGLMEKCSRLQSEVKRTRNELCLYCGKYKDAHLGACNGCHYMHGGEWEEDLK